MTTHDNTAGARQGEQHRPESTEELRERIDQTRTELADTVEALAAKTDVKSRVKDRTGEVAHSVRDRTSNAAHGLRDRSAHAAHNVRDRTQDVPDAVRRRPIPAALAAAGAAATAALAAWLIRRRR